MIAGGREEYRQLKMSACERKGMVASWVKKGMKIFFSPFFFLRSERLGTCFNADEERQ